MNTFRVSISDSLNSGKTEDDLAEKQASKVMLSLNHHQGKVHK